MSDTSTNQGVAAFFGIWPGDETDEELLAMLRELRGNDQGKKMAARNDVYGGIVSRLRGWGPAMPADATESLMTLAADWIDAHRNEITRLRGDLIRLKDSSQRWTPVEEQLPQPYTEVLGGCIIMGEWVEFITAWHKTRWYEAEPTHWMPLPAPPTDSK